MVSPSTKVALKALEMRSNCFTCQRWRVGQTIFNACHELYPEVANDLRASACDPFYTDSKVEAFLQQVEEKLSASSNG
mgnify:FL=1